MAQQEYVKKSLLSEIEEGLLKGAGIRGSSQSDYSNKASETSERDFAIPIQSLRKAIETGVDPGYAIPKWQAGEFAAKKEIERSIRAEAILENQLKFFFSKIEHNEKILVQDDSKKADVRWKDRVLSIKLVTNPFDSLLSHLKTSRPSLYRALQHHPMISGKFNSQSKDETKKCKRERFDNDSDSKNSHAFRQQKIRKSFVDSDNVDGECSAKTSLYVDEPNSQGVDDDARNESEKNSQHKSDDGDRDRDDVKNVNSFSLSCVVAKCIADGSLQAQLITLALVMHEYCSSQDLTSTRKQEAVSSIPIGNVLATLFENINCSSNFNVDSSSGGDDDHRKRLNKARGIPIRNPFRTYLHLHYSPYQRATSTTATPTTPSAPDNAATSKRVGSSDSSSRQCEVSVNIASMLAEQGGMDLENEVMDRLSSDSDDEDEDEDEDDDGDEDDDEMLAAALAMSMGGAGGGGDVSINFADDSNEDNDLEQPQKSEVVQVTASDGKGPEQNTSPPEDPAKTIPLLSEINPLSTFGPFCEEEFWRSIQSHQTSDNDVSPLSLQHVMVALLVNIGAGVDKAMLAKTDAGDDDKRSASSAEKKTGSLSSLVSSIAAGLVRGEQQKRDSDSAALTNQNNQHKTSTLSASSSPSLGATSVSSTTALSATSTLPIMSATPIVPHPISFLLMELLLGMFVDELAKMKTDHDPQEEGSAKSPQSFQKYFLVWSITCLLKLLNCSFSLLSEFKIKPSVIGLVDPMAWSSSDASATVTRRLMLLVLRCIGGSALLTDFETIGVAQRNEIETAILSGGNGGEIDASGAKELTLRQVQHSGQTYMHAIKTLATDVMASGFAIFHPAVSDRLALVQQLLEMTPLNAGLAMHGNEKFSPYECNEADEFSAFFNHYGDHDCERAKLCGRINRGVQFYDSLLLQKLCLHLVTSDEVSVALSVLSAPMTTRSRKEESPSPDPSDMLAGEDIHDGILEGSEAHQYRELERVLFKRLSTPGLMCHVVAQENSPSSEEIIIHSTDDMFNSGKDSGAETVHQVGGIFPRKSLFFGEICLYRLITQSYASVLTRNSETGEDSLGVMLHFDQTHCSGHLTIGDEGSSVSQTKSKTWASVLSTEGFEPETGVHTWVVRVDRSDRGHVFIGVGTSQCSLETYIGGDDQSWGLIGTKALWHNRAKIKSSYGPGFTTASSIRVKYDSDNGRVYFSDEGGGNWGLAFEDLPRRTIYAAVSLYQREDRLVMNNYSQSDELGSGEVMGSLMTSSQSSLSMFSPQHDPFAAVVPFVLFALSIFDTVEDILSKAESLRMDSNAETVTQIVAILTHPFISLILPIIASSIVINRLSPEHSSYLSVHLLPHLTLLTKRISCLHEALEKEVTSPATTGNTKLFRNIAQKDQGMIGNITGLWRVNSAAGGGSIPAQEYYLQIFSSPFSPSHTDASASDTRILETAANATGKYKPVEISGTGQGQHTNVTISGTVFGTRIRFNEQWQMGGTCLIDARVSLDGSSFAGTFKDVRSGIIGGLTASRVYNSATVSKILTEGDKFAMQLRQSPPSNVLLKSSLLTAMACGRLSANLIVSLKLLFPDVIDALVSPLTETDEVTLPPEASPSDEFGDDIKVDDVDADIGDKGKAKSQESAAILLNRWVKSELFSEGLEMNSSFVEFVGSQLQSYFSINAQAGDICLAPKAVDLKTWWLCQVFHGVDDYCVLDVSGDKATVSHQEFQFRAVSKSTSAGSAVQPNMTGSDYLHHSFYQQLQHNTGGGKCLDEHVTSYVGLSSLCKIGGDAMQTARRRVLAALIYHSGYWEVCTTEIQLLQDGKAGDCKPCLILLEIWRAAQKVIEHFIRQKQQSGVAYSMVAQEICKKSEFLMEVVPNSLCKDVTRNLQSTLSTEFAKKRSFDYYGTPINASLEKTYNAKNLSEAVDFFQSNVEVDNLKSALRRVSLKALFRSAGLRSVAVLLGKGISGSTIGSTSTLALRIPPLSTLVVQSAIVEYILPSMYGICDFTSDLNSKWMAELPPSPVLAGSPIPKDPSDNEEVSQSRAKKLSDQETSMKGHFGDSLQGSCAKYLSELRQSFEVLFELITQLLHRCTWAGDRDGQCVSLSAWDITIIPEDHAFLNRIGIFRVLQTVLDDTRSFLASEQGQDGSPKQLADAHDSELKAHVYARDMIVSAGKRLTQLALKIVHTLASQIAFCKEENDEAEEVPAPPQLNRQASGPETLSQALFDMLYTELFACLKQIIASSHGAPVEDGGLGEVEDTAEEELNVALGHSNAQFEEIGGEKYAYRILRLLYSVSSSSVCRRYLCSPKWLTLLLSGVGCGGLTLQRRLLRLLRKLVTNLEPKEIRAFTTDVFAKNEEILLSDRALDDADVECLISVLEEDDAAKSASSCAERVIQFFLKASTANIAPSDSADSNDDANDGDEEDSNISDRNQFLLNLYSVPSGTNSLCAESISLLRTLEEVPAWKEALCSSLRLPLKASSWSDPAQLRSVAAAMGVMGGYVDRVRVGGTVTLKPFSLVGLSETFALRLAAVSHSCGMIVAKSAKSLELVLMERSRKYIKSEFGDEKNRSKFTSHHAMSLAGGTPVRSVKMGIGDVIPSADVFSPSEFFDSELLNDCFEFVGKSCLPFVESSIDQLVHLDSLKVSAAKKRAESIDNEWHDVDGSEDNDKKEDDHDDHKDNDDDDEDDDDEDEDDNDEDDDYKVVKTCILGKKSETPEKRKNKEVVSEQHPAVSDTEALQYYVAAVSFRATAAWMQNPMSFDSCTEESTDILQSLLNFAVRPVQIGGLGELEAIEERWASIWEAYALLKFKNLKMNAEKKKSASSSSVSHILAEAEAELARVTARSQSAMSPLISSGRASNSSEVGGESSRQIRSVRKDGEGRGFVSSGSGGRGQGLVGTLSGWSTSAVGARAGAGAGASASAGPSVTSGMLSSMLSAPSSADAARAKQQMMDMGFPKEWCDVALRRCRYNVELAINLCFEHGSEMNQLVAEEAAMQSARSSSGGGGNGGTGSSVSSGLFRQSGSQSESVNILERLVNRGRGGEEPSSRRGVASSSPISAPSGGISGGLGRRRHLYGMGFPKSWCDRAMEAAGSDVDASIAWIIAHGEQLIAAEEAADKTDTPARGKSIEELLAAVGRSESSDNVELECDNDEDDDDDDSATEVDTDSNDKKAASEMFADSPIVDCSNSLSSICGTATINGKSLTCGGPNSNGFPTVGCRGHAVSSGKWYYEVSLETAGCIQIGWVDVAFTGNAEDGEGVGDDAHSWAYDGWRMLKWNGSSAEWGAKWKKGDVVGCALDMDNCTMSFFLNGYAEEINMGFAFQDFKFMGGLFPALSYNRSEKCTFSFNGRDLKYCPPDGYRPYAEHIQKNLDRNAILVEHFLAKRRFGIDLEDGLEEEKESGSTPFFEDCLEEQRGAKDFLPHRRYFQVDESRSGNNQLERQCQQLTLRILSARIPTSRQELLKEFQKLSGVLCILYARMMMLRMLSSYNRQLSEHSCGLVDGGVMEERNAKYFKIFFNDEASVESLIHILKESSGASLRTKVYLQTMAILSTSALPPPNLGSVLTVGGLPTLSAVVDIVSTMLVSAPQTSQNGCNEKLLASMLRCVRNELINSCRREFAAEWIVENGGTPVIYQDVLMLSNAEYDPGGPLCDTVPSLSLAVWMSSILMQQLFVKRMRAGGDVTTEECAFRLQWAESLISAWAVSLKSPVIAVKMCAARFLCGIIQQFFFVDESGAKIQTMPAHFFVKLKEILTTCLSLERIEKLVLHRMMEEKGAYPICSEYLQSLIEFSISLRTALESIVDDEDDADAESSCLSHTDRLHLYPTSKAETDDNTGDFNWDAMSGNLLSDDGWEIWTGNVKQLESPFAKPDTHSSKGMSFLSVRQHENTPPAVLPGSNVMRRRVVKIITPPAGVIDSKDKDDSKESTTETNEVASREDDMDVVGDDTWEDSEERPTSDDSVGRVWRGGDNSNASPASSTNSSSHSARRNAIAELHAASDRVRGSIAKLLSERGRRVMSDRSDRQRAVASDEEEDAPTTRAVMQFGTVIGICAWEGCAPGTARVVKWSKFKDKANTVEPIPGSIETVRWGGEGKYDMNHVLLDPESKKPKIVTEYPSPSSVEEVAAKNGFASELSYGVILRLRSAPSQAGDEEDDIIGRFDGLMEWPDFKSTVYITGMKFSCGDWVITEDKLVSGSCHTDWWPRFGTSSWRGGTMYTLSAPKYHEYARDSSDKHLLGQFNYSVDHFTGQTVEVTGDIQIQQSRLFSFDATCHAQSIQISHDRLAAACTGGEGKCVAFANVGFSSGVHYWEFKVEQCDLGNIYVGVAEKSMIPGQASSLRLNKWYGHGFVNMRTSHRQTATGSGERVYGDIFHTGDTVGVLLDMNRGTLSFFLDGMKYGDHLLTDLGVAFDGLIDGIAKSVQQKTLYPVIGFRRGGDRVTITPRWISTTGNLDTVNDLNKINRAWSLLSNWDNPRPSPTPRARDLWTYREAWRDWLRWRSDRYLKVRTRCRGVSLNLSASLDKCPRACIDASIRLGLSVALFHGDRIVFNSTCGRVLEAKEDGVILGALRGQLWYRLDSQREGDRGAVLEGSNANLAWCLAPYDMEDIELVRRGSVLNLLPKAVIDIPLARVPMFHGGLLRVVYEKGAVMRGGLEIDAADVVGTVAHDAIVFAVERRINSSNIARYRVFYEGMFGWISEKIRGGHEEFMVTKVSMDADSKIQLEELRKAAADGAKGNPELEAQIALSEVVSLDEAAAQWMESVLALGNSGGSSDFRAMVAPGGLLSEEFRRTTTETFDDFLHLATTMDGMRNWPVECDMLLTEHISHTASKEGQSPYNLSCDQIISSLALLCETSPLKIVDPIRVVARTSVIRVANSLISSAIPYLQMMLPEDKWSADCFGNGESDIHVFRKDGTLGPAKRPQLKSDRDNETPSRGVGCKVDSSAHHINRLDCDMNYLGDNFNQVAVHASQIWAPPCGARRMHMMRRVMFTQTKKLFWDNILESTTTATPLNQDEYEDPREIKDIRINRVKATQSKLASIGNMAERIRQSVFGQLHREMRQWPASSFRRSYLGKGHGGQCRAFKVKFMGEGVNDYGGPYRAVFEQVVDELQCDSNNVGSKSSDRCLLPLLVPCPNRVTAVGPNQDKFLLASSTSPLIQELMQFFGKMSGTALRHNLNMSLNLSLLLWRPMVQLPVSLRQLETIDTLTVKHLGSIEKLGLELEADMSNEAPRSADYIPDEWVDTFFTVTFADGANVSLVPGGEDISLTLGNWREYIGLVERLRLRESSVLYKAYRNGLSSVLPVELFSLFTPAELDRLFSGNNVVDVNLLRQCTEYEGILPDSELAKNFWLVLEEMSDDDRTLFLRFVWARSRMPASAQDLQMNFKLQADNSSGKNPDDYLPHAQTCFFSLSLPNYSSKNILRAKLLYAINNSPNMDADVQLHNAEGWADV